MEEMCKRLEEKNVEPSNLENYFKDNYVDEVTDDAKDVITRFFLL